MKTEVAPKQNYRRMLEEGHEATDAFIGQGRTSRLVFLSDHIFDFLTYEDEYSELFAKKAIEVCAAISNGKTHDYIKEPEGRLWYLLMVNMPFFANKLTWGSSIRGAWWEPPPNKKITFLGYLVLDGKRLLEQMEFTREEWLEFIGAIVEFGLEA